MWEQKLHDILSSCKNKFWVIWGITLFQDDEFCSSAEGSRRWWLHCSLSPLPLPIQLADLAGLFIWQLDDLFENVNDHPKLPKNVFSAHSSRLSVQIGYRLIYCLSRSDQPTDPTQLKRKSPLIFCSCRFGGVRGVKLPQITWMSMGQFASYLIAVS